MPNHIPGAEELPDEELPPVREYPDDAWALLSPQLTDARRLRMEQVARARTRHIRLVLQDIHQPHNVSAALRSAEAFGVLCTDVVTLREAFRPSTVARGVHHWLELTRHRSVATCASALKAQGYRLATALPRPDALALDQLPLDQPLAVVFGNEHAGVDPAWDPHIDYRFTIPMVGMVESLNISVAAAVSLYQLTQRARMNLGEQKYYLNPVDLRRLLNRWICEQTPAWEETLKRLRPQL